MTQTDKKMLEHLTPYNSDLSDTYLCNIYYKNKDRFMDSVLEKVAAWVTKNGEELQSCQANR